MHRYGISLPNVIGHSESLTSPYHRERYAPWRCQTHGDWTHADMTVYRRHVAALARADARRNRDNRRPDAQSVLTPAPSGSVS